MPSKRTSETAAEKAPNKVSKKASEEDSEEGQKKKMEKWTPDADLDFLLSIIVSQYRKNGIKISNYAQIHETMKTLGHSFTISALQLRWSHTIHSDIKKRLAKALALKQSGEDEVTNDSDHDEEKSKKPAKATVAHGEKTAKKAGNASSPDHVEKVEKAEKTGKASADHGEKKPKKSRKATTDVDEEREPKKRRAGAATIKAKAKTTADAGDVDVSAKPKK